MTRNERLEAAREEFFRRHLSEQQEVYARAGVPFERQHEIVMEMAFCAGIAFATWWLSEGCKEASHAA